MSNKSEMAGPFDRGDIIINKHFFIMNTCFTRCGIRLSVGVIDFLRHVFAIFYTFIHAIMYVLLL